MLILNFDAVVAVAVALGVGGDGSHQSRAIPSALNVLIVRAVCVSAVGRLVRVMSWFSFTHGGLVV